METDLTITAKVIEDSVHYKTRKRLLSIELRYPRFIHAELMTHRVFSRNSASSRAIPIKRMIIDIRADPVFPIHWGKNQPGMQAHEEHNASVPMLGIEGPTTFSRENAWAEVMGHSIDAAEGFDKAGYHKQIINRLLEPYAHITVLVTSSNWTHFIALRDHADAQPEIKALAQAVKDAIAGSIPRLLKKGDWHLPYISDDERREAKSLGYYYKTLGLEKLIKVSVARCARTSYKTQDGKISTVEKDLELYDRLVGSVPLHASPAEHQATPNTKWFGLIWRFRKHSNFDPCWIQYRKTLQGEYFEEPEYTGVTK